MIMWFEPQMLSSGPLGRYLYVAALPDDGEGFMKDKGIDVRLVFQANAPESIRR
jgi:hypothetical protein